MAESNKTRHTSLLIFLTFLAFVLRLSAGLNSSFFFDEAVFADYAKHPLWTQFYSVQVSPPIFPFITFLVKSFVGFSEIMFRIPSIILGCGTVSLTYLLGRKLGGSKVGLLSAILLAFNVLHQQYSQAATTHAYFTFYTILALYGFTQKNKIFLYVGLLGAVYTNDLAVILLGAYVITLLWSEEINTALKEIIPVIILYLPNVPELLNDFLYETNVKSSVGFNPLFYSEAIVNHASLAIVVGLIWYTTRKIFSGKINIELFLVWGFIALSPFLLYFRRYVLFILPVLTVLGVIGLMEIYHMMQKRFSKKVCCAFAFILIALLFVPNPQAYGIYPKSSAFLSEEDMIHKQQWKDAVSLVDGGLILVSQDRPSLVYYLDEAGKSFDVVQFDSVPELKEKIKDPSVRWVVVRNFKNGYRDYEDIVSYMKSRKDFTLEYELEYVLLFKRATTYLNEQWDI